MAQLHQHYGPRWGVGVARAVRDVGEQPEWAYARTMLPRTSPEYADEVCECAMQLVRLGADPNRKLEVNNDGCSREFFLPVMDGKSAFQIAAMSKRRTLVALMWEHMQLSPEDRAEVVHCRCGSRLPWKKCHSTGPGQPPHFVSSKGRIYYRVSPCARCPCKLAPKKYYKCCWNDNGAPVYLDDDTGAQHDWDELKYSILDQVKFQERDAREQAALIESFKSIIVLQDRVLDVPMALELISARWGPKSTMATWDRHVYAGCVRRLEQRFQWTDVHWHLDKSVLVRRARDWNAALQRYCDDVGIEGEERDRVVEKHKANACGPCGYEGCDAIETRVREFERCAQCRSIAYCSRQCQTKDWTQHKSKCKAEKTQNASIAELVLKQSEYCLSRLDANHQQSNPTG